MLRVEISPDGAALFLGAFVFLRLCLVRQGDQVDMAGLLTLKRAVAVAGAQSVMIGHCGFLGLLRCCAAAQFQRSDLQLRLETGSSRTAALAHMLIATAMIA